MRTVVYETEKCMECIAVHVKLKCKTPGFSFFRLLIIQSNTRNTVLGRKNRTVVFATDFLCSNLSVARPTEQPFQSNEPRFDITRKLTILIRKKIIN